jgi:hypothetical protein
MKLDLSESDDRKVNRGPQVFDKRVLVGCGEDDVEAGILLEKVGDEAAVLSLRNRIAVPRCCLLVGAAVVNAKNTTLWKNRLGGLQNARRNSEVGAPDAMEFRPVVADNMGVPASNLIQR